MTRDPAEIFRQEANVLRKQGFSVDEVVSLEPYDKAHAMIVAQR